MHKMTGLVTVSLTPNIDNTTALVPKHAVKELLSLHQTLQESILPTIEQSELINNFRRLFVRLFTEHSPTELAAPTFNVNWLELFLDENIWDFKCKWFGGIEKFRAELWQIIVSQEQCNPTFYARLKLHTQFPITFLADIFGPDYFARMESSYLLFDVTINAAAASTVEAPTTATLASTKPLTAAGSPVKSESNIANLADSKTYFTYKLTTVVKDPKLVAETQALATACFNYGMRLIGHSPFDSTSYKYFKAVLLHSQHPVERLHACFSMRQILSQSENEHLNTNDVSLDLGKYLADCPQSSEPTSDNKDDNGKARVYQAALKAITYYQIYIRSSASDKKLDAIPQDIHVTLKSLLLLNVESLTTNIDASLYCAWVEMLLDPRVWPMAIADKHQASAQQHVEPNFDCLVTHLLESAPNHGFRALVHLLIPTSAIAKTNLATTLRDLSADNLPKVTYQLEPLECDELQRTAVKTTDADYYLTHDEKSAPILKARNDLHKYPATVLLQAIKNFKKGTDLGNAALMVHSSPQDLVLDLANNNLHHTGFRELNTALVESKGFHIIDLSGNALGYLRECRMPLTFAEFHIVFRNPLAVANNLRQLLSGLAAPFINLANNELHALDLEGIMTALSGVQPPVKSVFLSGNGFHLLPANEIAQLNEFLAQRSEQDGIDFVFTNDDPFGQQYQKYIYDRLIPVIEAKPLAAPLSTVTAATSAGASPDTKEFSNAVVSKNRNWQNLIRLFANHPPKDTRQLAVAAFTSTQYQAGNDGIEIQRLFLNAGMDLQFLTDMEFKIWLNFACKTQHKELKLSSLKPSAQAFQEILAGRLMGLRNTNLALWQQGCMSSLCGDTLLGRIFNVGYNWTFWHPLTYKKSPLVTVVLPALESYLQPDKHLTPDDELAVSLSTNDRLKAVATAHFPKLAKEIYPSMVAGMAASKAATTIVAATAQLTFGSGAGPNPEADAKDQKSLTPLNPATTTAGLFPTSNPQALAMKAITAYEALAKVGTDAKTSPELLTTCHNACRDFLKSGFVDVETLSDELFKKWLIMMTDSRLWNFGSFRLFQSNIEFQKKLANRLAVPITDDAAGETVWLNACLQSLSKTTLLGKIFDVGYAFDARLNAAQSPLVSAVLPVLEEYAETAQHFELDSQLSSLLGDESIKSALKDFPHTTAALYPDPKKGMKLGAAICSASAL